MTPETKFNSAPVAVTDVAPSVNGVGTVTVPVNVGDAKGANDVERNALAPNVPPAPTFSVEPSVPENVSVLLNVNVFETVPPATEKPVAFAVNPNPFTDVAVAAPRAGVTSVGDVAKTADPDPVSSESAPASPAEFVSVDCFALICV